MPLTNKISNFLNNIDNKRKKKEQGQDKNPSEVLVKPASDNIRSKFDSLSKGGCV